MHRPIIGVDDPDIVQPQKAGHAPLIDQGAHRLCLASRFGNARGFAEESGVGQSDELQPLGSQEITELPRSIMQDDEG